jgi:3-phytase
VVQDGHKRLPQGTQNFKLIAWSDVVPLLEKP